MSQTRKNGKISASGGKMESESCSLCHGATEKRVVTYTQWVQGELIAVEGVPAGVCIQCGENYFTPRVADQLQKTIQIHQTTKTLSVPVFHLIA